MSAAKAEALKIIENLPDQATWDDIMYYLYINRKIEVSLKDIEEGRVLSYDEAMTRVLGK